MGTTEIALIEAHVLRCPVTTPVRTSFGVMQDRPALFLRIVDHDGAFGWGEVWCNFPSCGAEHRAALVHSVFAPLLEGESVGHPVAMFERLTRETAVLALQAGEPGPIAQVIAGIDIALWDLQARRANLPLWRLLGGVNDEITVYASGLNPTGAEQLAAQYLARGFDAFKLKVGFGRERDVANLRRLRESVGSGSRLMADANQAWDLETALEMIEVLAPLGLGWLEEPLRCDRPLSEWQQLSALGLVPLAAGENLLGRAAFDHAVACGALAVIQPDAAKWGGISGVWPVARAAQAAGLAYCPHYLGAGVGLLASAHLLAAVGDSGGHGRLEVDANPNLLRSLLCASIEAPENGRVHLGEAPGIGVIPDLEVLVGEMLANTSAH
ncbi:mandelate racemase [Burkholderia diffusa]|nr:mandelate racemase [Burkholderia diffusa]